jgi:hypothetical protein
MSHGYGRFKCNILIGVLSHDTHQISIISHPEPTSKCNKTMMMTPRRHSLPFAVVVDQKLSLSCVANHSKERISKPNCSHLLLMMRSLIVVALLCIRTDAFQPSVAFVSKTRAQNQVSANPLILSSFAADGSEYSSKESDYDEDDAGNMLAFQNADFDEYEDSEVQELSPVTGSKNSGSRFVALMWDQELDTKGRDVLELHYDRNQIVEDHVMFCRKRNLYNETFNSDSMVDIMRSLPL